MSDDTPDELATVARFHAKRAGLRVREIRLFYQWCWGVFVEGRTHPIFVDGVGDQLERTAVGREQALVEGWPVRHRS